MSALRNHVRLFGSLGEDAVYRSFQNGGGVVSLNVATAERWTDPQGEKRERVDWHKVAIFTDAGIKAARELRKGDWVEVDGKLETRSYEKQGEKRYVTEIVLRGPDHRLIPLPKRPSAERPREPEPASPAPPPPADLDDDVPF